MVIVAVSRAYIHGNIAFCGIILDVCRFGSYIFSKKLGILFNDQMKDFREYGQISDSGSEDTTMNVILPGKRVPSLMSPSIIVDKNKNVVMVVGAAGGSRIPSVLAQVRTILISQSHSEHWSSSSLL